VRIGTGRQKFTTVTAGNSDSRGPASQVRKWTFVRVRAEGCCPYSTGASRRLAMSKHVADALNRFKVAKLGDYGFFAHHNAADLLSAEKELFDALVELDDYKSIGSYSIREIIDGNLSAMLLVFSMKMATFAVRARDERGILCGLLAIVLDNDKMDGRDIIGLCCILHDAASRIGIRADTIFERAAQFATPSRRSQLFSFLEGESYQKSLTSMGVEYLTSTFGCYYKFGSI
jgi:hypothetical protein